MSFAVAILGNQYLEGKIEGDAGRRDHERRARFRIAEDEEFGGTHLQTGLFGLSAMIDQGE